MENKELQKQENMYNKEKTKKTQVIIPMDNVYIQTVLKLFNRYLIEEATGGGIFADVRLANLLKDARKLHRVEREEIISSVHTLGRFDETNAELVFMQKKD